jgi:hypothetical protein
MVCREIAFASDDGKMIVMANGHDGEEVLHSSMKQQCLRGSLGNSHEAAKSPRDMRMEARNSTMVGEEAKLWGQDGRCGAAS